MRQLARLSLTLCLGICVALPAAASGAANLYFTRDDRGAGLGTTGSVRAEGYYECTGGPCPPSQITLTLTRGGAVVGSAGPGTDVTIRVAPEAGDVARVYRDGVEKQAVPFDLAVDDYSCAIVGRSTVSGSFSLGPGGSAGLLEAGLASLSSPGPGVQGTLSTSGNRFTASFPRAIARGDGLGVTHYGAGVTSLWTARVCPPPPPTPPPNPLSGQCLSTLQKDPYKPNFLRLVRKAVKIFARYGAQQLRTGHWAGLLLPTCQPGRFTGRVTARHRGRTVVLAKGSKRFGTKKKFGTKLHKLWLTPNGRELLEALDRNEVRRIPVRLSLRLFDADGGSFKRSPRLQLHLGTSGSPGASG